MKEKIREKQIIAKGGQGGWLSRGTAEGRPAEPADNRLSTRFPQNILIPNARRGTEETAGNDVSYLPGALRKQSHG